MHANPISKGKVSVYLFARANLLMPVLAVSWAVPFTAVSPHSHTHTQVDWMTSAATRLWSVMTHSPMSGKRWLVYTHPGEE